MKTLKKKIVAGALGGLLMLSAIVGVSATSEDLSRKVNEYEGQHFAKVNEYEGQHRIAGAEVVAVAGDPSQWGIAGDPSQWGIA